MRIKKVPAEEKDIDDRKNIIKTTKKRKKKKPLLMGISAEEIESLTVKIPFMAKKKVFAKVCICLYCSKAYLRRDALNRHICKVHPNEEATESMAAYMNILRRQARKRTHVFPKIRYPFHRMSDEPVPCIYITAKARCGAKGKIASYTDETE